jgi:pimeloyl-ACP methyl ester carboxylesterase
MQLSHYITGQGEKALIFLHPANDDSFVWQLQVNAPVFKDYLCICIDLPGHGKSPRAADYSLPSLGKILAGHIGSLALKEYVIVTLSLGSAVASEALPFLPGCRGLFMTGACLTGQAITPASFMKPFEYGSVLFEADPDDTRLDAYLRGLIFHRNEAVIARMIDAFKRTDPLFRTGLGASVAAGKWNDELASLKKAAIPFAFLFGEKEQIIDYTYLQQQGLNHWRNTIHQLKEAGHLANLDQPDTFNQLLADFLKDIWD